MRLRRRQMRIWSVELLSFCVGTLLLFWQQTHAQTLPANFAGVELANGLDPVSMVIVPDGRVFVTEKAGRIRVVKNGTMLPTPLITIPNVDNYNERGLQGIVLDPNFPNAPYVYVFYAYRRGNTRDGNNNRVSRFQVEGDVARLNSEQVLLDMDPLTGAGNHNGGDLLFKDGKLFILVGDNAHGENSQSLSTLKGKVLRINPDGSIPTDNPFYNSLSGNLRAIWALGLRNPFKGAVQPGTGRIFINDVGGGGFEEINEGAPGKNYGWPAIEGKRTGQTPPADYQDPVLAYGRDQGCSITAAAFYNPSTAQFPGQYVGKYFFADYCSGWIKTFDPSSGAVANFASGINRPLDIKIGNDGSLYLLARGGMGGGSDEDNTASSNGVLWRLNYTGSGGPVIAIQPLDKTATEGSSVTFSVNASGNPAPSYQWQRNQVNIDGATSASYTIPNVTAADNGAKFRVIVTNAAGTITSNEATLTLSTNQKPVARIITPSQGATYLAGGIINFSGTGTDPEDGDLPASAFQWKIDLYHYDHAPHLHPALEPVNGITSGSFVVPTVGHTETNVLYRIYLTVTDSKGASSTTTLDVNPIWSNITLATTPGGLNLKLDGATVPTPYVFKGVTGIERNLEAPAQQVVNSSTYTFHSWSNNGSSSQVISTPSSDFTYTANYIRSADAPAGLGSGLDYSYYEGNFDNLPDFNTLTPAKTGKIANFDLSPASRGDEFAFRYKGYVNVPTDGRYTFYTNSDDGSKLYIGKELIVSNDGLHAAQEAGGIIYLKAGWHPIEVIYFERGGDQTLTVNYDGPGINKQIIPASALASPNTNTGGSFENTYEAESAQLFGVITSNLHNGYTGNGFADFINNWDDYIEWTVNVPVAGTYTLAFRYALGGETGRSLRIVVNDQVASPGLNFAPTPGGWTDWQYVRIDVNLAAGNNKIRAYANGNSGANIDHLKVSRNAAARLIAGRSEQVRVYPNPVADYLEIIAPTGEASVQRVEIVSQSGQIMLRPALQSGRVDLSRLATGIYMVRVITADKVNVFKVMKR